MNSKNIVHLISCHAEGEVGDVIEKSFLFKEEEKNLIV